MIIQIFKLQLIGKSIKYLFNIYYISFLKQINIKEIYEFYLV